MSIPTTSTSYYVLFWCTRNEFGYLFLRFLPQRGTFSTSFLHQYMREDESCVKDAYQGEQVRLRSFCEQLYPPFLHHGFSPSSRMKVALEVQRAFGKYGTLILGRICPEYSLLSVSTGQPFHSQSKLHDKVYNSDVEHDEELEPAYVVKLCKEQRLKEAFQAVALLQKRGFVVTRDHIYSLLQGCTKRDDLEACRRVHSLMVGNGLDGVVVLVDHLIRLFTSSRCLEDANRVFNRLTQPTIHTWNALLTAHTKLDEGQRALSLFHSMDQWGIKPDKITFLCVLKACSNLQDMDKGQLVHKQIMNSDYGADTMLGNALVDMYSKCGNLQEALEVFEDLPSRDIVSLGAMITGYVQHGQALPALELFEQIMQQGVKPSKVIFLGMFKACGILSDAIWGRLLHSELIQTESTTDLVINNSLIDMYTKCGLMADAQGVFKCLPMQDEVSWGTMLAGFVKIGDPEQTLRYFDQMQQQGLKPNSSIYSCLIKACGLLKDIVQGLQIHDLILVSGVALDMVVCSSLVDMYVKCEALQEARNIFNTLPLKDLVLCGSMIAGYCTCGDGFAALELFGEMLEYRIEPDKSILISLLKACVDIGTVDDVMLIHHYVTEIEIDADASIIDIYSKCGCLKEAYVVLSGPHNRDPVSWCSMIAGFATQGHGTLALKLFEKMQCKGIEPNRVVLLCTLQACGSLGSLYQSWMIHDKIIRNNFELDPAIANTLIDVYSKCDSLETASKLFDTLCTSDVVHWGTMLAGYVMHGQDLDALKLFRKAQDEGMEINTFMFSSILKAFAMHKEGCIGRYIHNEIISRSLEMDMVVGNSLILMYSRQGHMEDAYWVLESLPKRDAVSWATIIAAHSEDGQGFLAMQDFEEMQNEGVRPSLAALVSTVKACSNIGALRHGRIIHNLIVLEDKEKDEAVGSTLVELYSRSGSVDEAWQVLSMLPRQEAVAWGALIAGCAHHGNTRLARCYFSDMLRKGVKPDSGVFTGLLAACSQEGLMKEGHQYLMSMSKDFGMSPGVQHYSCIIDLFGRAGHFDQTKDFLDIMPVYPDMVIWMSLLTSCRTYTNVSMANWCCEELLKLDAIDAACCILMSNIYSDANLWKDAKKVRKLGSSALVRKQPGIAWLKVDNGIHEFVVGGEGNPQGDNVRVKTGKLAKFLRGEGFVALLNLVSEPPSRETKAALRFGLQDCNRTGEDIESFTVEDVQSMNNVSVHVPTCYTGKQSEIEQRLLFGIG